MSVDRNVVLFDRVALSVLVGLCAWTGPPCLPLIRGTVGSRSPARRQPRTPRRAPHRVSRQEWWTGSPSGAASVFRASRVTVTSGAI